MKNLDVPLTPLYDLPLVTVPTPLILKAISDSVSIIDKGVERDTPEFFYLYERFGP